MALVLDITRLRRQPEVGLTDEEVGVADVRHDQSRQFSTQPINHGTITEGAAGTGPSHAKSSQHRGLTAHRSPLSLEDEIDRSVRKIGTGEGKARAPRGQDTPIAWVGR